MEIAQNKIFVCVGDRIFQSGKDPFSRSDNLKPTKRKLYDTHDVLFVVAKTQKPADRQNHAREPVGKRHIPPRAPSFSNRFPAQKIGSLNTKESVTGMNRRNPNNQRVRDDDIHDYAGKVRRLKQQLSKVEQGNMAAKFLENLKVSGLKDGRVLLLWSKNAHNTGTVR